MIAHPITATLNSESSYQSSLPMHFPQEILPSIDEMKFFEMASSQDELLESICSNSRQNETISNWLGRVVKTVCALNCINTEGSKSIKDAVTKIAMYIHYYVDKTCPNTRTFFIKKNPKSASLGFPYTLYINKETSEAYIIPREKNLSLSCSDYSVRTGYLINYVTNDLKKITVINNKNNSDALTKEADVMGLFNGKEGHLKIHQSFDRMIIRTYKRHTNLGSSPDFDLKVTTKKYIFTDHYSCALCHIPYKPLSTHEMIFLCKVVVKGLEEAHKSGIYHGSIYEKKIWFNQLDSNQHKLSAALVGWNQGRDLHDQDNTFYHSIENTAPEVLNYGLSTHKGRQSADVYALGLTLLKFILKSKMSGIPLLQRNGAESASTTYTSLLPTNKMSAFQQCSSLPQMLIWYRRYKATLDETEALIVNTTLSISYLSMYNEIKNYLMTHICTTDIELYQALDIIIEMINPSPELRPSPSEVTQKLSLITTIVSLRETFSTLRNMM